VDVNKLLSYEYFGLLTPDESEGVESLRDVNKLPGPYTFGESGKENLDIFKELLTSSPLGSSGNLNLSDEDFADLFANTQKINQWLEVPENRAMAGATVGGIVAPTLIPGVGPATLPARVVAIMNQYPRIAKVIAAITGGFGGAAPFIEAETPEEFLKLAAKYGLVEGLGEGVIQGVAKFFPLFKSIIKNQVMKNPEKGAKEAIEQGTFLTPAQATTDRIVDTIENIASNAWIGGGQMAEAKARGVTAATENIGNALLNKYHPGVAKVMDNAVEDFVANAGSKDFAGIIQAFLKNGRAVQDVFIDQSYKQLDKVIEASSGSAQIVNISGLKKYVAELKKKVPTDSALATVYKQILSQSDNVDFTYAKNLRSMFLGNTKAFIETGNPVTNFSDKVSGNAFGIVNREMENAVKLVEKNHYNKLIKEGMGVDAAKNSAKKLFEQINGSFRSAQDFYSLSKDSFNSTMVGKIINAKPDAVYNMLMKSKSPDLIKQFNKLLEQGVKDKSLTLADKLSLTKSVQGEFFAKILTEATDANTGIVNAGKLFNQLRTFGGTSGRALKELFDSNPDMLKDFKSLTRSLALSQTKGIEGANGGFLIQLIGAGAIGTAIDLELGWEDAATFGLIFGGPKAIANAFTNPQFIKNMFKVNKLKPGTDAYTRSVIQMLNDYVTNGFIGKQNADDFIDEGVRKNYLNEDAIRYLEERDKAVKENKNKKIDISEEELESKSNLLKQLEINTLDDESATTFANMEAPPSRSVSLAPLNLGPLNSSSAPPSQSINPNTLASLDAVGMPLFQAKDGGIASLKNFKKPQVVS